MHILTLVANSTLPTYIRRNYRTVLRTSIVGMVLTRQRALNNEQFNVMAKKVRREGGGGGGELKSLINDIRHSGTTTALYRILALSKKDGLKWYIIVNTAQGQG